MKNLEKHEMRSHNKVHALFAENKVHFARAEQLWHIIVTGQKKNVINLAVSQCTNCNCPVQNAADIVDDDDDSVYMCDVTILIYV